MNIFNRILALLFLLLLLALAVGIFGLNVGLLSASAFGRASQYAPLHHALGDLGHLHPQIAKITTVAVAVVVAILAAFLLALEVRPPRREKELILSRDRQGEVAIGYSTLRKIAEKVSLGEADVSRARCRVSSRKESLWVKCDVTADPFADANHVGTEIETTLRNRLEHTVGKPVEHIRVKVELAEPGDRVRVR